MTPQDLAPLLQALGAPMVLVAMWVHHLIRQKRNGSPPEARQMVGELREINASMKVMTEAMKHLALANQDLIERVIVHDTQTAPAIQATLETSKGVNLLVEDMRARQRGGRRRQDD